MFGKRAKVWTDKTVSHSCLVASQMQVLQQWDSEGGLQGIQSEAAVKTPLWQSVPWWIYHKETSPEREGRPQATLEMQEKCEGPVSYQGR